MATKLARTTEQGAVDITQKLMDRFAMTALNIDFNCKTCGELYGCYIPETNTVCFQPENGEIPIYVVYHEFGHALSHMYQGEAGVSYDAGEGFARHMEQLYLSTDGMFLDWHCDCGNDTIRLLPDGSIQCLKCGSVYYAPLYSPSLVPR